MASRRILRNPASIARTCADTAPSMGGTTRRRHSPLAQPDLSEVTDAWSPSSVPVAHRMPCRHNQRGGNRAIRVAVDAHGVTGIASVGSVVTEESSHGVDTFGG
jgi:hypothetical protein